MKKLRASILIVLSVIFVLIIGLRMVKFFGQNRKKLYRKEYNLLLNKEIKFSNALKKNNISDLYNLFNETFRAEIDSQKFRIYLDNWSNGRKVKKIRLQNLSIVGKGGHITCWVNFSNNEKTFLYQSWLNTKNGWKLMWLTKIFPRGFNYGALSHSEIKKIQQAGLKELITNNRIQRVTFDLAIPKAIIIKQPGNIVKTNFHLSGHTVYVLSLDQIKKRAKQIGVSFYLEFGAVRIIDDIATCYLDIHPLYAKIPQLSRLRGMQLYFVKENNDWVFNSYGTKW